MNRIRSTVRIRFCKVVLKVGCFDLLFGFEILAIIYVAHAIMLQLLEGHIDKHCCLACLGIQ